MTLLAREITLVMVEEYGPRAVLQRLADPFWFQSFGCVLGFDWHSSGITTTVCGALKEGLRGREQDTGIFVAGGKGKTSRQTPRELDAYGERAGLDPGPLVYSSRMAAKVDSAAVQDNYELYHHTFIVSREGGEVSWCVVQQGMNAGTRMARRYHWLSTELEDFTCEPHHAVCSDARSAALNMVALEAAPARDVSASLAAEKPAAVIGELRRLREINLPRRHRLLIDDIDPGRIERILLRTYERPPADFETLLATRGVGAKAVRALALVAELVYGAPAAFRDPARYAFAHGGKDRTPYPVDRETYDRTIETLKRAVDQARLGRRDKLHALRRLSSL
jgi:hypothetical protein